MIIQWSSCLSCSSSSSREFPRKPESMAAVIRRLLLFVALLCGGINRTSSFTDPQDVAVLQSLRGAWLNTPPSWGKSDDPCGVPWEGITCNDSRVTALGLSSIGIKGQLSGDIGGLTQLGSLDLSYNPDLIGPISPRLGDLQNLHILILAGCGFSGTIPNELGSLSELTFLALNNNKLTGQIPPSLGKLSKLYWLDLAENQLSGTIPVSNQTTATGLDQLMNAKHFHFNKNQLSGPIPEQLFSSEMILIHVLFDSNQLNGSIPSSLGLVKTLEALRLDRNSLTGAVPTNLNNLTSITELNLANNGLTGPLPDLSDMNALNYVDLSNNSFDLSFAPIWFSNLPSVNTIIIEHGSLKGLVPEQIFGLPQIQQVKLRNNAFSGILNTTGNAISSELQLIDLENNQISSVDLGDPGYTNTLMLIGNPVCDTTTSKPIYCQLQQGDKPYSTSLTSCGNKNCPADRKLSPQSCSCSFPYEGTLIFRAPSFRELSDATLFQALESTLWKMLELPPGSVFLENPSFNTDDYLQVQVALFPPAGKYFNRTEILRIGFSLNNQNFKAPKQFGPYLFIGSPYTFPAHKGKMTMGMIVAVTVCGTILVLGLIAVGIYAVWQKRRAEKAIGLSRPFASWVSSKRDSGGAPQLKGARWFSYDELKKCTGNFSESNEVGSGGYGKVYKGTLPDGHTVAIKRAQKGSAQGSLEFKTEIELLSRVHHKNLVSLVGFSFEQGDQMLVYEYIPNGTLRASLSGKSGIHLDWRRRLRVALSSARGLSYLHELADPPIIHRDIKSTNILLDENLTAKVADFGLSKLVSDSGKGHVSTQVKGTLGYLDPEYYMTQQLTNKSDVYSFGVVMLELITSKQPIEKGKYIVREVRNTMDATDDEFYGLRDMIDPTIKSLNNYLVGFGRFVDLAMQCVEESASARPTMSEVVKIIETILHNEGLSTNSTSASSSSTDFGTSKGARSPYDDTLSQKDKSG